MLVGCIYFVVAHLLLLRTYDSGSFNTWLLVRTPREVQDLGVAVRSAFAWGEQHNPASGIMVRCRCT